MGTNKKQTAVDWLLDQMFNKNKLKYERGIQWVMPELVEQAKQMFREQIEEAFLECNCRMSGIEVGTINDVNEAKEYYKEKYGK